MHCCHSMLCQKWMPQLMSIIHMYHKTLSTLFDHDSPTPSHPCCNKISSKTTQRIDTQASSLARSYVTRVCDTRSSLMRSATNREESRSEQLYRRSGSARISKGCPQACRRKQCCCYTFCLPKYPTPNRASWRLFGLLVGWLIPEHAMQDTFRGVPGNP